MSLFSITKSLRFLGSREPVTRSPSPLAWRGVKACTTNAKGVHVFQTKAAVKLWDVTR